MENSALVMPERYAIMNVEEMNYVDGGGITLAMLSTFTQKSVCMQWAIKLVDRGNVKGMSYQGVAEEIFAHAYVYYNFYKLPSFIKNNSFAQSVYRSSADGINIADNGDTWERRAFYSLVWNLN